MAGGARCAGCVRSARHLHSRERAQDNARGLPSGRQPPVLPVEHIRPAPPKWQRNARATLLRTRAPLRDCPEQCSPRSPPDRRWSVAKRPAAPLSSAAAAYFARRRAKTRSASIPGPLSAPSCTSRRISSNSIRESLCLTLQSRNASRTTSPVLAYSPLATASRTALKVSSDNATVILPAFAMRTSGHRNSKKRRSGKAAPLTLSAVSAGKPGTAGLANRPAPL